MKRVTRKINNIVVISDTHCGCSLGLCPPSVRLDDGGTYSPSRLQKTVWGWWREFWDKWVPVVTKGEPYDVVFNGDAIDGVHHNSTTQITHNMEDQISIAFECLNPIVQKIKQRGGSYYHIRGTQAHVGSSGIYEEQLAKRLGAVPSEDGQYARWELWKTMGANDLIHFTHHIGTTSSSAHESSAINAEISAMFTEAARWGEKAPSCVVRSHRHRCMEVRMPNEDGFATAIVTPAWQLKTPFTFRIAGARISTPQLGGILIRHGDRMLFTDCKVWNISRSNPV